MSEILSQIPISFVFELLNTSLFPALFAAANESCLRPVSGNGKLLSPGKLIYELIYCSVRNRLGRFGASVCPSLGEVPTHNSTDSQASLNQLCGVFFFPVLQLINSTNTKIGVKLKCSAWFYCLHP